MGPALKLATNTFSKTDTSKTSQIMWLDRHMCHCNGNASAPHIPYRFPGSTPCFRDFNTQCSPIPWVSHLLCVERGGNTAAPSLHICPATLGKTRKTRSGTVPSHHLWSPMDPSLSRFTSQLLHETRTECAFPGLPYSGCSTAYNAAQIFNLTYLKHALDPLGFLS